MSQAASVGIGCRFIHFETITIIDLPQAEYHTRAHQLHASVTFHF
jgi:hypothetical protein